MTGLERLEKKTRSGDTVNNPSPPQTSRELCSIFIQLELHALKGHDGVPDSKKKGRGGGGGEGGSNE